MSAFLHTKGITMGLKDYIGACEASFSRESPFAGDRLLHFS